MKSIVSTRNERSRASCSPDSLTTSGETARASSNFQQVLFQAAHQGNQPTASYEVRRQVW
jgi:hypothetical protein